VLSAMSELNTYQIFNFCLTSKRFSLSILKNPDGTTRTTLPAPNLPVAFPHPEDSNRLVFIGGEMPHWIKKFVNRLEQSSSSKSSVSLKFRGQQMSLDMIKDAWLWDDEGFGSLRKTKLTEDHFYKNAYSRMRVHLAAQVLSQSVVSLIERYGANDDAEIAQEDNSIREMYGPLKELIASCDRLIDIWNGNREKKCENIDSPNHPHINELRKILVLFDNWRAECGNNKEQFITKETWEDLCWLVYGLEGLANQELKDDKSRRICQRRGGSDCCENTFAAYRQGNSNGTELDIRQMEARRGAYRGQGVSCFSRAVKSNSGREDRVDIVSLSAELNKKRKRENIVGI